MSERESINTFTNELKFILCEYLSMQNSWGDIINGLSAIRLWIWLVKENFILEHYGSYNVDIIFWLLFPKDIFVMIVERFIKLVYVYTNPFVNKDQFYNNYSQPVHFCCLCAAFFINLSCLFISD